jgi:hypothetical protein
MLDDKSHLTDLQRRADKNNPSNYKTIMITPMFAKLMGGMERKLNVWVEDTGKGL